MIERYLHLFQRDELIDFLERMDKGLPKSIRCNTILLNDCTILSKRLGSNGFYLEEISFIPNAYWVKGKSLGLGSTLEHLMGYYYIQGAGSMIASLLLSPEKGEKVADLAAAPGGKTSHMAQLMDNKGCILAVDNNEYRVKKLRSNLQRMHVKNALVIKSDARNITGLEDYFDKIMLDTPCTGEGLIVFKKERKLTKTIEDLRRMSVLQLQLLEKGFELLRPGGKLLYTTCSIAPEENEYVLTRFLSKENEAKVLLTRYGDIGSPGLIEFRGIAFNEELKKCLRVYPHRDGVEGFFYCIIRKDE
jgi:NOL1/NOP2/sun family putative RNA methylase